MLVWESIMVQRRAKNSTDHNLTPMKAINMTQSACISVRRNDNSGSLFKQLYSMIVLGRVAPN